MHYVLLTRTTTTCNRMEYIAKTQGKTDKNSNMAGDGQKAF